MTGHVKVDGLWKNLESVHVKVGGSWKSIDKGFTKIDGAWKEWFSASQPWVTTDYVQFYVDNSSLTSSHRDGYVSEAIGASIAVGESNYRSGNAEGILIARASDKTIIFSRSLTGCTFISVSVDDVGNIYASGETDSSIPVYVKFNSSGNLVWQKTINATGSNIVSTALSPDYQHLYLAVNGADALIKVSTSDGSIVWQKQVGGIAVFRSVSTDSSGKIFLSGNTGADNPRILSISADGNTVYFCKRYGQGDVSYSGMNAVGPDGDVYLTVQDRRSGSSGISQLSMYRINGTTGAVIWGTKLDSTGWEAPVVSPIVDGQGNLFYSAHSQESVRTGLLGKVSSSGTLEFQRELTISGTGRFSHRPIVTPDNKLALFIRHMYTDSDTSTSMGVYAQLPSDGTKTGTYSVPGSSEDFRYLIGSRSTGSITVNVTDIDPSLTNQSYTVSDHNGTLYSVSVPLNTADI